MNKQKTTLPTTKWGTLRSKYKPESNFVLVNDFTAGSSDFITSASGAVDKRTTDALYNTSSFTNSPKDQFEAVFSSGVRHLLVMDGGTLKYTTGDRSVSTASAGFTANASMEYAMYQNRVYLDNGVDNPSVYDMTASYGGVSYSVPHIKTMGCQVPGSAPSASAGTSGGAVPNGAHTWKVTFLYYGAEESNGSSASGVITVTSPNSTVPLTIPVGGYGVTARKIYRDNNDGNYLLVGTVSDNTATTFSDTISAGTTAIPTANNLPSVFSFIATNLSRVWVASGSVLSWSNPGQPNIFDPNHTLLCNPKDPMQAVYIYQGTTYVLNRHSFGRILGTTDDSFYYDEVPGSVGCTDNRSIQIRTLNGVPTLIWLSDRGFYAFNGSSPEYISDPIEDLVNLNIQQVQFVTGSNVQSSQSDFQAGTASAGIDLNVNPGVITTKATSQSYQSETDWETGSLTNLNTNDTSNALKVVTAFAPSLASGTYTGSGLTANGFTQLATVLSQTVPQPSSDGNYIDIGGAGSSPAIGIAQRFVMQHNGTIPSITLYYTDGGANHPYRLRIYSDLAGSPNTGNVLAETTGTVIGTGFSGIGHGISLFTFTINLPVTAGTFYWVAIEQPSVNYDWFLPANAHPDYTAQLSTLMVMNGGSYITPAQNNANLGGFAGKIGIGPNTGAFPSVLPCTILFSQTPITGSGAWTSPVYDSHSVGSAVLGSVTCPGTYPSTFGATTAATLSVDMSNDATFLSGVTTSVQSNPNGTYTPSMSNNRYWRLRYSMTTTDNRTSPFSTGPSIKFSTTATWVSPAIDCTTDVVSYNALAVSQSVPTGTSVTVTVATSDDNISYTAFGAIGSAAVKRYLKVKAVLTTTSNDITTPSVSSIKVSWNLSCLFTSSIINVGQVPSGWGLFQDIAAAGAGTVAFLARSASTSGGISSATFYAVSNGSFPTSSIVPLQYVQWKAVITTSPGTLPTVDSVTINWFMGNNATPIRAASLFFNKTYYLAAAELNQTANNVVISYDQDSNWRVWRNVNINSLGLFFNQPFYADAVRKNLYQWLVALDGTGSAISMDVRTKAFDMGIVGSLKMVRSFRVTGINTGTTIHSYYSVDRGTTWIEMLNVTGTTGYVTTADGSKFSEYFVPDYSFGSTVSGTTVMFRVTSSDAFPCSILTLEPELYVRKGKYIGQEI